MRSLEKKSLFCVAAVAMVAMLSVGASMAEANLVQDGNLNDTIITGTFNTYTSSFDNGIWSVSGSIDLIGTYWQQPPNGGQSVDLDGNSGGIISQTFATTSGQKYQLTFELSGNPDKDTTKYLDVSVGNVSNNQYTFVNSATNGLNKSNMGWEQETLDFTATSNSTTLKFTGLAGNATNPYGAVIGNIDVEPATATPLPGAAYLLGPGLMALMGLKRKYLG